MTIHQNIKMFILQKTPLCFKAILLLLVGESGLFFFRIQGTLALEDQHHVHRLCRILVARLTRIGWIRLRSIHFQLSHNSGHRRRILVHIPPWRFLNWSNGLSICWIMVGILWLILSHHWRSWLWCSNLLSPGLNDTEEIFLPARLKVPTCLE